MNIGSILTKVGTTVLKNAVPGAGIIIDLVNEFLPKDKQLPNTATGTQIMAAVNSLPPEVQQSIFLREMDVEVAEIQGWSSVMQSLSEADKSGNTTRPQIALMMSKVTCFVILLFSSIWAVAIVRNMTAMAKELADSWELMLVVLATPTALLRAYFGMRMKQKKSRYELALGEHSKNTLADIISAFRK